MPANLPPQYYTAEQKYRGARNSAEKVAALRQMLSAIPKHKGTDHLRADLRAKVARALDEIEGSRRTGGQPQPYAIRKEGVGQAVLIGLPNAGKSRLVSRLTGAPAKVGDYPFTTRTPLPGMLRYQNVWVQLVDTPAINDREVQARLFSMLRNTDLLLVVLDLSGDPLAEAEQVLLELDRYGFRLVAKDKEADSDDPFMQKKALLVANKSDVAGAAAALGYLRQRYGHRFPIAAVSAATGEGLDELGAAVFTALGKVRVYLKSRGALPDLEAPLLLQQGSMVEDAARSLHKDWAQKLKYALLWGSGKFEGQRVGRDYVLSDGDIIELHS